MWCFRPAVEVKKAQTERCGCLHFISVQANSRMEQWRLSRSITSTPLHLVLFCWVLSFDVLFTHCSKNAPIRSLRTAPYCIISHNFESMTESMDRRGPSWLRAVSADSKWCC